MSNQQFHTHLNDENTPLLHQVPQEPLNEDEVQEFLQSYNESESSQPIRSKRKCSRGVIAGSIFIIVILLLVFSYFLFDHLQQCISGSVELELTQVSFQNTTPQGVNLIMESDVNINYKLKNAVQKFVITSFTSLIGTITIQSLKPIEIYSKFIDLNTDFIYLGNLLPPPMNITVVNGTDNQLNFISECNFKESQIMQFLKYYYKIETPEINLKLKGIGKEINVKYGFINFSFKDIVFAQDVVINKKYIQPNMNIETFKVNSTSEMINVDTHLSIETDLVELPELNLEKLSWNLMFEDCTKKLIKVGKWFTLPLNITKGDKSVSVFVKGSIESVPDCLMEDCGSDISPINHIIQQYLHNQPVCFYLQLNETKSNLPSWLIRLLQEEAIRLYVKLPKIDLPIVPRNHFCINSSNLYIDEKNINLDSNFTIFNNNSLVEFDNLKFRSSFDVINGSDVILKGETDQILIEYNKNLIESFLNNLQLDLIDPKTVGQLLNKILNNKTTHEIYSNVTMHDIEMKTPLFMKIKLKELKLPSLSVPCNIPIIDYQLLDQLNVTIDSIFLIESTNTQVKFLIDLSLINPTSFSIDMLHEITKFGIYRKGLNLGNIIFNNVYIPNQDEFYLSCEFHINLETYEERVGLENFISSYISNGAKNLSIDVYNNELLTNPNLNKLIEEVSIKDLQLPNLKFQINDLDEYNPFIVEVIIHVFTSEIEIKVFNPINNSEIIIEIFSAQAKHEDIILGYLSHREILIIPPGISQTQRLPLKINSNDSMDILKRYLNNELDITIMAIMNLQLDKFDVSLLYNGKQLKCKIRF
ncbi:unnamed protein product [Candida verbasci]|uniref:Tag1-like fifth Ig-like domain-containing protein n=1 Tax=Candida verbasci TaxID=1227364 RepID=A0A9W4XNA6_9ASCO|nr:unnamed protein product [Candida verbasci]